MTTALYRIFHDEIGTADGTYTDRPAMCRELDTCGDASQPSHPIPEADRNQEECQWQTRRA